VLKRMDRPHIRVIPEWFGGGTLPRKELHEAAEEVTAGQAGLIAAGEPTTGKGLDKALTGAAKVVKHAVEATTGEITSELQEALKEADMVDMHLEVDIIPVSDVDRAKEFYQRLGWRLDQDVAPLDGLRIVQFTPPGSAASVTFGLGLTMAAVPGRGTAARPRPRAHQLRVVLLLHRSRRQYVAGPGGHRAAPRPSLRRHPQPRHTWPASARPAASSARQLTATGPSAGRSPAGRRIPVTGSLRWPSRFVMSRPGA